MGCWVVVNGKKWLWVQMWMPNSSRYATVQYDITFDHDPFMYS